MPSSEPTNDAASMSNVDTFDVTETLAHALVAEQHPDLAERAVILADSGWDNAVFRLGDDLALRIPRRVEGAVLIDHERAWLPTILDGVPDFATGGLDASAHVRDGDPGCGYPWGWAVIPWHEGAVAASAPIDDVLDAADRLGRFLAAVHRPASGDAPANPWRGGPIAARASLLDEHLDRVEELGRSLGGVPVGDGDGDRDDGSVTRRRVEATFAELAAAASGDGAPLWLHGDLHPGNLIVHDAQLRAVIDFGDITAGDRATDLSIAWALFGDRADARARFREVAGTRRPIDDATWDRARAWAVALNVAYLQGEFTTPDRVAAAQRGLTAALSG
ncbi:MAG: phosphotransferase [Actinobacteria bacterium]|nr:phosphotransferase [Actinomycetota bacterium]